MQASPTEGLEVPHAGLLPNIIIACVCQSKDTPPPRLTDARVSPLFDRGRDCCHSIIRCPTSHHPSSGIRHHSLPSVVGQAPTLSPPSAPSPPTFHLQLPLPAAAYHSPSSHHRPWTATQRRHRNRVSNRHRPRALSQDPQHKRIKRELRVSAGAAASQPTPPSIIRTAPLPSSSIPGPSSRSHRIAQTPRLGSPRRSTVVDPKSNLAIQPRSCYWPQVAGRFATSPEAPSPRLPTRTPAGRP